MRAEDFNIQIEQLINRNGKSTCSITLLYLFLLLDNINVLVVLNAFIRK